MREAGHFPEIQKYIMPQAKKNQLKTEFSTASSSKEDGILVDLQL